MRIGRHPRIRPASSTPDTVQLTEAPKESKIYMLVMNILVFTLRNAQDVVPYMHRSKLPASPGIPSVDIGGLRMITVGRQSISPPVSDNAGAHGGNRQGRVGLRTIGRTLRQGLEYQASKYSRVTRVYILD